MTTLRSLWHRRTTAILFALVALYLSATPKGAGTGYVIPTPVFTGWNNNGTLCASCLLYVYAAGTTTPATSYSDQALTIPNSNPVVLDSAGRATVFIPDASVGTFKFVLKTNPGVTIWTQDNVAVPSTAAPPAPAAVPAGAILPYGGASAPSGYLLCDGTAVSRTTYAALFSAIGTAYGVGDGSTTFNLPDLRQRFPLGKATAGTGSTLGGTGGTIDHTHTGPNHTHTITIASSGAHTHTVSKDGWGSAASSPSTSGRILTGDGVGNTSSQSTTDQTISSSGAHTHTGTTDLGGTGVTGTANAPFQAVQYVVKT